MDKFNQLLCSLWGSEIETYKFNLVPREIDFQLITRHMNGESIRTQLQIKNIRMFCFGDMFHCKKEHSFPIPPSGTWSELTEIESSEPGNASIKVYFNSSKNVPSPYFDVEQNLIIEIVDAILTISAGKIVINEQSFIWNQDKGCFEGDGGTVS